MLVALALVASTVTGITIAADISTAAAASRPAVDGWVISWSDGGWYQVQTKDGSRNVCEGGRSCDVKSKGFPAGTYKVINHSTNQKWSDINVSGSGGGGGSPSPAPSGSDFTQSVPRLTEAKYNGTYVSLRWDRLSNQKGVNIYRNGRDIKKSINSGTVFNDYDGKSGDTYYIVAYSHNNELSKKSDPVRVTSGGEVSGVRNLQATKQSANKIKLTWQGTSTAVKEWRIYRGGKHWRTVTADKNNPGRTYIYYDGDSTVEDAAYYSVRAVGFNGTLGEPSVALSPLTYELAETVDQETQSSARLFTPAPPAVPSGNGSQSQQLANQVNQANAQATRTENVYHGLGAVAVLQVMRTKPWSSIEQKIAAGDAMVDAEDFRRDAKKAAEVAAEVRRFYDRCRASTSCWDGKRPDDSNTNTNSNSRSHSQTDTNTNSNTEPDKGTSHTRTDGV